jgi:peroxiredoxin
MKAIFLGAALFSVAATSLMVLAADDAPAAEVKKQIAPEAEAVVGKMSDFYASRQSATAEVTSRVSQALPKEPKRETAFTATLAVARPNQLAFRVKQEDKDVMTFVADGKTVWVYVPELKQFIVDDAPAKLDDLIRDHPHISTVFGEMGALPDLFRDRSREVLLSSVTVLRVVGTEKIDNADCTRIHGEQEDMDWDAWIQDGPEPALRQFAFNPLKGMLATAPDDIKKQLDGAKIEAVATYKNWRFDPPIAAAAFAFEPPKDAKKVSDFGPPEETAAAGEPGSPEKLKGQAAPDFSLDLLGGGKMQLAQNKGKVVVLDFWASWCGPCVRALPSISEIAAAYKDKGVVVFALNQQEEADAVKKFLEAKKLALTVAMDAKGEAAKLFQVSGIPQTVIIDKEGKIAAVHVGYSPGLKEALTKEIDAALAK